MKKTTWLFIMLLILPAIAHADFRDQIQRTVQDGKIVYMSFTTDTAIPDSCFSEVAPGHICTFAVDDIKMAYANDESVTYTDDACEIVVTSPEHGTPGEEGYEPPRQRGRHIQWQKSCN